MRIKSSVKSQYAIPNGKTNDVKDQIPEAHHVLKEKGHKMNELKKQRRKCDRRSTLVAIQDSPNLAIYLGKIRKRVWKISNISEGFVSARVRTPQALG